MTPIELLRPATTGTEREDRALQWTATLFVVAVLVHGADHARRGVDSIGRDVFWLGSAAIVLEVAVVVLACQRHRLAPLAATLGGFSLAAGYLAVHFLPGRSVLSDSFISAVGVSVLSWIAASAETIASMAVGAIGLRILRARGGVAGVARPNPGELDVRSAVLHPVALTMIVGNVVLLVLSVAQIA